MLRILNILLPEPHLHCAGPLHLGNFRNIFLPNVAEDQKKVSPSERGPQAVTVPYYDKFGLVIALHS